MSSSKNLEFKKTAFLNKSNSAFIEEMYLKFVNNDPELPDSWRKYFKEVGDEDDIIAPACPILRPGGAVIPAINPTIVFFIL